MDEISNNPIVSVIVPCYNHGNFLFEALDSLAAQTFTGWECIVVDNGSTDNTREIAEKFTIKDKRFKFIFTDNKGVSSARNFAIKNSSGKYILPLDADDKIGKTYLAEAVKILDDKPDVKIVYCGAMLFGEMNRKWELEQFTMEGMLIENLIFCSAFFRRSDYDKSNGYNEEMLIGFEDWDFWLSLLSNGGEVYKIPQLLFYYRIRTSSRNNLIAKNLEMQRLLRNQIYERHKELYQKYISLPYLLLDHSRMKYELQTLRKRVKSPLRTLLSVYFSKIKSIVGR